METDVPYITCQGTVLLPENVSAPYPAYETFTTAALCILFRIHNFGM
jgi:hypothetical protein